MKRKVCVITGSRADYGLMRLLIQGIEKSDTLTLQLIATGMHLSSQFGFTVREIEKDGFNIDFKIDSLTGGDTPREIALSISKTLIGCSQAFDILCPDLIVVLGDRFEIFAAATAALVSGIPLSHIHGGESTLGSYDESFRHSITKMSQIHFVATEEYRNRVIQLGENPNFVFKTGAIGNDDIQDVETLTSDDLERELGIQLRKRNLVVTFHPATLDPNPVKNQLRELLKALDGRPDTTIIFTGANADTGGTVINSMIKRFVREHQNAYFFESLGRKLYLSCLANFDGVVGNSSSGIIEAPSFKVGTVNIGNRQQGRIQAKSIVNCNARESEIREAIDEIYSSEFRANLAVCKNPYEGEGVVEKIISVIESISLKEIRLKPFFNVQMEKTGQNL